MLDKQNISGFKKMIAMIQFNTMEWHHSGSSTHVLAVAKFENIACLA